jgi:hypothetical protein
MILLPLIIHSQDTIPTNNAIPIPKGIRILTSAPDGACMVVDNETRIFVRYLPNTLLAAEIARKHLRKKVALFKKQRKAGRQSYGIHATCGYDHFPNEKCVF